MAEKPRGGWENARNPNRLNPNILKGKIEKLSQEIERHMSQELVKHLTSLDLQQQSTQVDSAAYREALAMEVETKISEGEITVVVSRDTNPESLVNNTEDIINRLLKLRNLQEALRTQLSDLRQEVSDNDMQLAMTGGLYSPSFREKLNNPEHAGHQIAWLWAGAVESIAVAGKFTGETILGVVKIPYDLYQVVTGKAEIESRVDI